MDISVKEPLYIFCQGQEYVVRPGTVGVERNKVVFFYDSTRTAATGFPRDYCLENPQTFLVARTLSDKEISLRDAIKVIEESPLERSKIEEIIRTFKSL